MGDPFVLELPCGHSGWCLSAPVVDVAIVAGDALLGSVDGEPSLPLLSGKVLKNTLKKKTLNLWLQLYLFVV